MTTPAGRYRPLPSVDLAQKVRAEIRQRAEQGRVLPPELQVDLDGVQRPADGLALVAKHVLLLLEETVYGAGELNPDHPAVAAALELMAHPGWDDERARRFAPRLQDDESVDVLAALGKLRAGAGPSSFAVDRLQAALARLLLELAPDGVWERKIGFSKQAMGNGTGAQVVMLLVEGLHHKGAL